MLAKVLLFAYVLSTLFMYKHRVRFYSNWIVYMIRGSVTASLIGYALLMHVKEFGQLLIGISSLLEKISRGLYYEGMKLSSLCTAEYRWPSFVGPMTLLSQSINFLFNTGFNLSSKFSKPLFWHKLITIIRSCTARTRVFLPHPGGCYTSPISDVPHR